MFAIQEDALNDGRREFVKLLVFFGTGAALAACGSSSDSGDQGGGVNPPPPGDCSAHGAKAGSITGNHGHSLMVPKEDFSAGMDKVYDIQGSAAHSHTIALTADQLATILSGSAVSVASTVTDDHAHQVSVVCA